MLDGSFQVASRDDWAADYLRYVRMRNPNAKTGPGEYYDNQARNLADMLVILSADAQVLAGKISLQDRTGTQLDDFGRPVAEGGIGRPRPGKTGASGALQISTTLSGTDIRAGDRLTTVAGVTYLVVKDNHQLDGSSFAVTCNEAGPQTNLPAGAKLTWSSPRPGCYATATVVERSDGLGLTGGHEAMGDDEYRDLLCEALANPAASANDAELRRWIQDIAGHGVAVQKAFTYGCCPGPSMTSFAFTMGDGGGRCPSQEQINLVAAHVEANMPSTDSLFKLAVEPDEMKPTFRVKWNAGWTNAVAWPPFMPAASRYVVRGAPSALVIEVGCADGVYEGRAAPQIDQALGLFDVKSGKFKRKTIASVAGTGPWVITCDATPTKATELEYTPVAGQYLSPWSDSLDSVAALVVAHITSMGPGEIVASLPSEGMRVARSPRPRTNRHPSEMDGQLLGKISLLPSVQKATHEDESNFVTKAGDAHAVYLATLADLGIYP